MAEQQDRVKISYDVVVQRNKINQALNSIEILCRIKSVLLLDFSVGFVDMEGKYTDSPAPSS